MVYNESILSSDFVFLRPIFGRRKRPTESIIRTTMDWFRTTFTLVNNADPERRHSVRAEVTILPGSRVSKNMRVPIHFMEDFTEKSWFAGLQKPIRTRIVAE